MKLVWVFLMWQDSSAIAETLENYFLSGEVDKIEIVYSR